MYHYSKSPHPLRRGETVPPLKRVLENVTSEPSSVLESEKRSARERSSVNRPEGQLISGFTRVIQYAYLYRNRGGVSITMTILNPKMHHVTRIPFLHLPIYTFLRLVILPEASQKMIPSR